MAKQNVSFVERNLEKLVLGATALVFLAVMYFYGIQSPNTVEVRGEALGPSEFYRQLEQQADQARRTLANAQPTPGGDDDQLEAFRRDYSIPTQMPEAFAQMHYEVPRVQQVRLEGKVELAEILAPAQPVLRHGRAYANVPPPVTLRPTESEVRSQELSEPRDLYWVTVTSAIFNDLQRNEFISANYALDKLDLHVVDIEMQRQVLLPSGQWSEPVIVYGYQPLRYVPPKRRVPVMEDPQAPGRYVLSRQDVEEWLREYIRKLPIDSDEARGELLRFDFQKLLGRESELFWEVPRELPELGIDLGNGYGLTLPQEQERGRQPSGRAKAAEDLRKAERLIGKGDQLTASELDEIRELLDDVLTNEEAREAQTDDAEELLKEVQPQLENLAQARAQREEAGLGPPVEAMWQTDLSAQPGQTYRYRVRVLAKSNYLDQADKLKDIQQAGIVLREGNWSEWSEPLEVPPAEYIWLSEISEDGTAAEIDMVEWSEGSWQPASGTGSGQVRIGESVAFEARGHDFEFDAVLVDIERNYPYSVREERRGGREVIYRQPQPTSRIVLVDVTGRTYQRIAAADEEDRRQVLSAIKAEERRREELKERERSGGGGGERRGLGIGRPTGQEEGGGSGYRDLLNPNK